MPEAKRIRNRKNVVQAVLTDAEQAQLDECMKYHRQIDPLYPVAELIRCMIADQYAFVQEEKNRNNYDD